MEAVKSLEAQPRRTPGVEARNIETTSYASRGWFGRVAFERGFSVIDEYWGPAARSDSDVTTTQALSPIQRPPEEKSMSGALSFAELEEQPVELLPARTVLSQILSGMRGNDGEAHNGPHASSSSTDNSLFPDSISSYSNGIATPGKGGSADHG